MEPKTLTSLLMSIKKWDDIYCRDAEDLRSANCALCQQFVDQKRICDGCPVYLATGLVNCVASPWVAWAEAINHYHLAHNVWLHIAWTPELAALAKAERDFLVDLLPEPHRSEKRAEFAAREEIV